MKSNKKLENIYLTEVANENYNSNKGYDVIFSEQIPGDSTTSFDQLSHLSKQLKHGEFESELTSLFHSLAGGSQEEGGLEGKLSDEGMGFGFYDVTYFFPEKRKGGAETLVREFSEYLKSQGFNKVVRDGPVNNSIRTVTLKNKEGKEVGLEMINSSW